VRVYPDLRGPRLRTLAADAAVVLLLAFFAWAGVKVHDTVIELNSLSRGVQNAGGAVRDGFSQAAGAVGGVPFVGGKLSDGLKSAGAATGGNVVEAGKAGESAVSDTARVLGWAIFLGPALVLLALYVPLRGLQIRRLTSAARMLGAAAGPERTRLLAMRAAFGLSWRDLRPYSRDPIGDLEAERYAPLVEALYASAGLRPPRP